MTQNKYDNEEFFEEYIKLRREKDNANVIEEAPALFSLINNDLSNKTVLDQTTPNMIQGLKGIFARKPLISREI